jgi:hypothetical protein
LQAAFSNAGLQATWCAQGKRAAEHWGKLFNVDVTWFDGELSPTKQRKAIDNMTTQKWDFVAIQALTEGTLTDPVNRMIAAGIPVISIDTLIAPYDQANVHTRLTPDNNFMGTSVTAEELGHVELVSNGVAMPNNGPDTEAKEAGGADITQAPFKGMQDIRLAPQFFSAGGGALPMNSGGHSWNMDHVTTTGNVIFDLLHNFHLECGARLHKLRLRDANGADRARGVRLPAGPRPGPRSRLRAGSAAAHRRRRHQDTADAQHQPRADSGGSEIHG